jgi:hypothetical protein
VHKDKDAERRVRESSGQRSVAIDPKAALCDSLELVATVYASVAQRHEADRCYPERHGIYNMPVYPVARRIYRLPIALPRRAISGFHQSGLPLSMKLNVKRCGKSQEVVLSMGWVSTITRFCVEGAPDLISCHRPLGIQTRHQPRRRPDATDARCDRSGTSARSRPPYRSLRPQ